MALLKVCNHVNHLPISLSLWTDLSWECLATFTSKIHTSLENQLTIISVLKSGPVRFFCLFWCNWTATSLQNLKKIGNRNHNRAQLVACSWVVGCNWLQSVALQTGPRLLSTSCNWWYLQVCLHFWDYLLTIDCFVVVHSHIDQTIGSSQHSAASLESHKPTSRSTSSLCFVCSKFVY